MVIYILLLSFIAVIVAVSFLSNKCPSCGQHSLRVTSSKVVDRSPIFTKIFTHSADASAGGVKTIRVTKEVVRQCKNCTHEVVEQETHTI